MKTLQLKGKFREPEQFEAKEYKLLPFDFERLDSDRVLITNLVGEYAIVPDSDLQKLVDGNLSPSTKSFKDLESRHVLYTGNGILESIYNNDGRVK